MTRIEFRFYEELNDFLPPARRKSSFVHNYPKRGSVKDMIESLGVPHTEVELILVNGRSVDFSFIPGDGDRISVYPMFESLDVTPLLRLRPRVLRNPQFVLDGHLGRLARYLRMLGFDSHYRSNADDAELAETSARERRVLLTRDRRLLHRKIITHGYFVRNIDPRQQISEVLKRFDLYGMISPGSRCVRCNGVLHDVEKHAIVHRLQPLTRRYYHQFRRCDHCGQLYWQGSHFEQMRTFIEEIVDEGGKHSLAAIKNK